MILDRHDADKCYATKVNVVNNFGKSSTERRVKLSMNFLTQLSLFGINPDSTLNLVGITHAKIKYNSCWICHNLPISASRWVVSSRCMSSSFSSLLFSRFHLISALAHWLTDAGKLDVTSAGLTDCTFFCHVTYHLFPACTISAQNIQLCDCGFVSVIVLRMAKRFS